MAAAALKASQPVKMAPMFAMAKKPTNGKAPAKKESEDEDMDGNDAAPASEQESGSEGEEDEDESQAAVQMCAGK